MKKSTTLLSLGMLGLVAGVALGACSGGGGGNYSIDPDDYPQDVNPTLPAGDPSSETLISFWHR